MLGFHRRWQEQAQQRSRARLAHVQVRGQERDANEQAATAKGIAEDAQRDLDAALPALDAAVASLKNLSRWGCAYPRRI